jgi:transposase-like protein
MTAAQVVDKLLSSEHADVIREAVRFMVAELMEAEVAAIVGAELGERAPERRSTQRNGYRERGWDTRVGEIELQIPRLRSGRAYFPSFLEPRRRAEQALVALVQEAYVNGVSTRRVDRLVEQLGVRMTKDQVSRLCARLDEQVAAFASGRWRAPTRTCGSTPSTRRSATAATSCPRPSCSPTASTRPGGAK